MPLPQVIGNRAGRNKALKEEQQLTNVPTLAHLESFRLQSCAGVKEMRSRHCADTRAYIS